MTLRAVPTLDASDMLDELISLKGELAAANRIMAAQSEALTRVYSALLSSRTTLTMAIAMIEAINSEGSQ